MDMTQMLIQARTRQTQDAASSAQGRDMKRSGSEQADAATEFRKLLEQKQASDAGQVGGRPESPSEQIPTAAAELLAAMLFLPAPLDAAQTQAPVLEGVLPIQAEGVFLTGLAPQAEVVSLAPAAAMPAQQVSHQAVVQPEVPAAVPQQSDAPQPAQETASQPAQEAANQTWTLPQSTPAQDVETGSGQPRQAYSGPKLPGEPQPDTEAAVERASLAPERPLFQAPESLPVKVGEPVPLDTTKPDFDANAAKVIAEAFQRGESTVELKLSPAGLGSVSVELSKGADGVLHVVLMAEKEQTLRLLNEHAPHLSALLQDGDHAQVRIDVPRSQEGQQAWQQPDSNGRQQQGGGQQQQRQERQSEPESFLQQLRLGLIQTES